MPSLAAADLAAFAAILLAAWAVPGPAMLYALVTTLSRGRRAGFAAAAGLAAVAAGWTGAALIGLDAVFVLLPWTHAALKTAGGLYLLWIAVQLWRQAGHAAQPGGSPPAGGLLQAFRGGMLVNLGNPKSVLFAASVLVLVFPAGLAAWDAAVIVGAHFAVETAAYGGLVALAGSRATTAIHVRFRATLDRLAAGAMAALGLRLLTERDG